jgi:hypothetical protein
MVTACSEKRLTMAGATRFLYPIPQLFPAHSRAANNCWMEVSADWRMARFEMLGRTIGKMPNQAVSIDLQAQKANARCGSVAAILP